MNSFCLCACENGFNNSYILLGSIVQNLVQGLLFGGAPPLILHITDEDVQPGESNVGKYVSEFLSTKRIGVSYLNDWI